MATKQINVLVIDDSALVRQILTKLLETDPAIKVVATASDPIIASDKIKKLNPDVITLDVEMPRMDGLEFLEKLMQTQPLPVVMVSSLTNKGADATIRALELGAVDFVGKPKFDISEGLTAMRLELCEKVKAACRARIRPRAPGPTSIARLSDFKGIKSTEAIIAIGASTGGVEALTVVLRAMPADSPAVVITQHMPEGFTKSFATRLDGLCAITVAEATDGARVLPGHAYIAPGSRHLTLVRSGANYVCKLGSAERVSGHCPSVDVLFRSVATAAGKNAIGVILTGMGRDGADGLLQMRQAGAMTFGQDEATCVVYGMPRAAFEGGAVQMQLPIDRIAENILRACTRETGRLIRV